MSGRWRCRTTTELTASVYVPLAQAKRPVMVSVSVLLAVVPVSVSFPVMAENGLSLLAATKVLVPV